MCSKLHRISERVSIMENGSEKHENASNEFPPQVPGSKLAPETTDARLTPRLPIAWKITGVVILVMFTLAIINIFFTRNRFTSVMESEFLSKGKTIATSLATSSEDKLFSGYLDVVQDLVDSSSGILGVRYIFIKDKEGQVVAHSFEDGFHEGLKDLNPVEGDEEFRIAEIMLPEVGRVMEVAVPIIFGAAGTAHVGMDRGIILDEVKDITTKLIIQFAIASLLGIILLHLTVQFLLRHLKTILDVLSKAGKGDLSIRLKVSTNDEFDVLAEQLNATLEHLGSIISGVRHSFQSINRAQESITRVYSEVLEGSDQQANLASETMESVTHNKKLIDEVTQGIHVLEGSASDSFSSIMQMGASIEEVSSMSDSLFRSVNEANESIQNMSSSIGEISQNLLSLSKATEETASSMSEMGVSIQQVRENTESTSADAIQMTQIAEEGVDVSRNAMEGTLAIKESSSQVSQLISVVTERIEEIDEILSFITDITGKTNLLALNAAIIASQAGAQGKGFGVVADEINELAQNTKAQTNRIAGVIQGIREEVLKTGEAVAEATGKVERGVQLNEQVTTSLEKIVQSTKQVSQRVEEIARTTSEQANTSNRVMETTEHLSGSVNNIKEVGQMQSESSEKLLEMSRQIQQVAQKVKTSTEEQTSTSQQINSELTKISDSVHRISESTDIQVVNGNKVFSMTEDLTGIIEKNRQAVHGLQEVISELAERMGSLQGELSVLIVQEDES
ncbi:HAMP domain-containing protein [bacterium]|nr:MAG: HAMP domain-containing protein [bacterium]